VGDFDAAANAALQALLPHISLAFDLHRRLCLAEHRSAALAGALDQLSSGVILTDALTRPLFVNARAAALAEQHDGLIVSDTGLFASTQAATQALREAIAAASAKDATASRRLRLARPSQRFPLLATVLPIGRIDLVVPGARRATAAIFIQEIGASAAIDRLALAEAFRLTRRESEVAALLAQGIDIEGIAARLGLNAGTVRNHLKRAFEKTGMRSQAALVALVRGFTEIGLQP
jgi:DNA-binding CsgD family transcriptional regulator